MIYEFITPSDPITFKADDDKVAYICALLLGQGKAVCKNITNDVRLETFLAFFGGDPDKEMQEFLGCPVEDFINANKPKIAECFGSFAYGSVSNRQTYDDACNAITDPVKLKEFKEKEENRNRSSMSKWVQSAWLYSEKFTEPEPQA